MNNRRNFLQATIGTLAGCFTLGAAKAQSIEPAKFTIQVPVKWKRHGDLNWIKLYIGDDQGYTWGSVVPEKGNPFHLHTRDKSRLYYGNIENGFGYHYGFDNLTDAMEFVQNAGKEHYLEYAKRLGLGSLNIEFVVEIEPECSTMGGNNA